MKTCHVWKMLEESAQKRHVSFHTPGHKVGKWDITELSYSDNLSCPRGCIARAEADIAEILGAKKSFILTDGSTSGVFAMLYAAKCAGVKAVALPALSHKSVYHACAVLGLTPLLLPSREADGIPVAVDQALLTGQAKELFLVADALLLTSPDYYGNIPDLQAIRALCQAHGKLFLIDGAHGGHLHFEKSLYAGAYADLWVDGVHKSLPAFTQGAVVSARTEVLGEKLLEGVQLFRTTSPSYPIMASVEYAVKYPRNLELEAQVRAYKQSALRVYQNRDWTKFCVLFGKNAFEAEKELQKQGIFAEFCDGNVLTFYLSPATKKREFFALCARLEKLFEKYPYERVQREPAPLVFEKTGEKEWVELKGAEGRICAGNCGLFPPCTPLCLDGERLEKEKLALLENASNVFGLKEQKILVYKDE